MGLDMYLTRKFYIGADFEHRNVKASVDITIDGKPVKIDADKITYIETAAGYWRKANQIHNWFVKNVQNGEDDCGEHYVSVNKLIKLRNICKKILDDKSKGKKLLPTKSGFFFGDTEYGEFYFNDIKNTLQILNDLNLDEDNTCEYYYSSSW